MSIPIFLHPRLDESLCHKIGFEATGFSASYIERGKRRLLNIGPPEGESVGGSSLCISDPENEWTHDIHGFELKREFHISNPGFLFGPKGLVMKNAVVGLGIIWRSKTSSARGAIAVASFDKAVSEGFSCDFGKLFLPGTFRGQVNFSSILYLLQAGTPDEGESHLANTPGMILGELDDVRISIDGAGSLFPVVEMHEPSQPLWWVYCDWTDPLTELFDTDAVSICINKAHPGYSLLNNDGKTEVSQLLLEIIASGLQIIITKLQKSDSWDDILENRGLEEGSIGAAIHYFIRKLQWDYSSPERLAVSIRSHLDKQV